MSDGLTFFFSSFACRIRATLSTAGYLQVRADIVSVSSVWERGRETTRPWIYVISDAPLFVRNTRSRCSISIDPVPPSFQPEDLMRYTTGAGGGAVPDATALLDVAKEPVVLYSHVLELKRVTE